MSKSFIYDTARSPRASSRSGVLASISPSRLSARVLSAVVERNQIDSALIEDVIFGCAITSDEQGANVTRTALLAADYDYQVPGMQVSRFCSSGLEAVNTASAKVASGQLDAIVAGGIESISRVPMGSDKGAWQADPRETFKTHYVPQGISADLIATKCAFSRSDVDAFAVESHRRAAKAQESGYFKQSIVPVYDQLGELLLDVDNNVRPDSNIEKLAKLKPSFQKMCDTEGGRERVRLRYPEVEKIDHVHTAANSSAIVDGSAAVLLGSDKLGEQTGLRPRARIVAAASIGSEPTIMLTGPKSVTELILKKAGMQLSDIDLFEVNEAFASVPMFFMDSLGVDHDKVNVNGGAISLGHPFGATGAILIGTLLDELERRDLQTGMVVICVGGGMGTACIIQRC